MDREKEIETWRGEANTLLEDVKKIKIQDDLTYREASETALLVTDRIKIAEAFFKPMVDSAYQAHRIVCESRSLVIDPLKAAKDCIKLLMGGYDLAQRKKREEAEAKARAEAEAKEREKREKLEAKAQVLEAQGETEKAEAARQKAEEVFVAPKPVAAAAEKPQGVANRTSYDVVILDSKAVPEEYKIVDMAALKKVALATKGKVSIPGVKFVEKIEVVLRSNGRKDY